MIDKIIGFSIRNKLIIGLFVAALIGGGIWAMLEVPVDAVPDITNNQVQVITTAPDLGTVDIEQFITYPVERVMSNLPGVVEIRSISRFGLSVVTIVFEDDMGTYLPRQLVNEKLPEVREIIPEGFGEPFMGPISTGLGEIYQYVLVPQEGYEDEFTPIELRSVQDWIVKRQMAMVPGVVEVNSFGGGIKQYEVAVNPEQLRAQDVTLPEVYRALEANNENTGGGYIERNNQAHFIRGEGKVSSIEEIEQIVVKTVDGIPILVEDVAEVQISSALRYGAFTMNGQGEAIGGMILMLKGANAGEVIENVKERMAQIQLSLPEGLEIEPFLDRTVLVERTTSTVTSNLLEGGLIVIFVLVLLLGNWRGGLIVASTIPLSLLFAFIMMYFFDVWANLMSLGAIDFGIIVDGAVIIVEGVVFAFSSRIGQQMSQEERDKVVQKQSSRMMRSAFFGQLIILIVFIPILALEGVEGKMFRPMAMTFGFAILGAMILCLTWVPMASALFLKPPKNEKQSWGEKIVHRLENWFTPILDKSLKRGKAIIIGSVLLLGLAVFVFIRMGGEFIPQLDEGDIAFHVIMKPGTSLSETMEATTKVERLMLAEFPEAKKVLSRIGVADVPTDPMPMDIADVFVILKEKDEWTSAESKEELIAKMKEALSVFPGINYEFTQPIEMRFNELLSGVREDVAVKLFGEDLEVLAAKAEEMGAVIATVPGVADMKVEATTGLPQMQVTYDRGKLAQYGLEVEELNRLVRSAFAGGKAGIIFEGERRYDLVVRLQEEFRQDIQNLQNLYVSLDAGQQVPLEEVATIRYEPGPMQISRDNTQRRTYVGVNIRGRDVESVVTDIQERLQAEVDLPPGYFIQYGGSFENLQRAKNRLKVVVPIALLLIFILIYFALGSLPQALMIYMAIPLAAIGGVLALWLRGMPFSISAGVGFIVLFGVAVLNGLVLIDSLNGLKEEGMALHERILQGTTRRIRPILLTASTDILGFLPMALSTSAGAEVQRPLATVVIGGLLTSTLLTLVVLPILYRWVENGGLKPRPALASLLLPLALLFSYSNVDAQEPQQPELTLEEALQRAREHYPALKRAALAVEQQQALKKTALDLGRTQVFTGGEEQGGPDDGVRTLVGVQQQQIALLEAPARAKLQRQKVDLAQAQAELTEAEVALEVRQAWYSAAVAKRSLELYRQLDSLYTDFERAARIRYEVQETSRLEMLAAQTELHQIELQLRKAQSSYRQQQLQLQQWVLTEELPEVQLISDSLLTTPLPLQAEAALAPALLNISQQQLAVQEATLSAARAALLPDFSVQYGLQQIAGNAGFYTWQAGISIPLWFRPQQGRIQAAKIGTELAELALQEQQLELQTQLQALVQEYRQHLETVQYYQQEALPLAREQIRAARLLWREGAVDYVAYIQALRQAMNVREAYLSELQNLLNAKSRLQYFTESTGGSDE